MHASRRERKPEGAEKSRIVSAIQVRSFSPEMAHHRPIPSALSAGWSYSAHARTRKVVNYA